jgi:prefoldin subunit 5
LRYHDGLNVDVLPFNPRGSCEKGGIYYADDDHICEFLCSNVWVREVTIPDGARVYPDPSGNKYKADRVILGPRIAVQEWLRQYIDNHQGSVSGSIHMYGSAKLDALTSVGGSLSVGSSRLDAPALTSVGGNLYVDGSAKLDALTSVGGYFYVDGSAKLDALTSVGGDICVYTSAKFDALMSVGGSLCVYYGKLDVSALTSVGGSLYVYANAKLDALALTSVGSSLYVHGSAKLDALTSVGGNSYPLGP